MARICLAVLVSVCLFGVCLSLPPPSAANVRLYLTTKGVDYANKIMVNNTVSTLEGRKVSPVSITKSSWWYSIRLSLFNSIIKSVVLGPTSIQFENGQIKLSMTIGSAEVVGSYDSRGGFLLSGKGSYNVKMKNIFLIKYLSIGINSEGKPFLLNGGCVNTIEETTPEFTGGSSFIINLLVALVKSSVNTDVRNKICKSISESVDKAGKWMPALYPDRHNVSRIQCAQVNFPILEQPLILTDYIAFLMEGGVNSSCFALSNFSNSQGISHIRHVPRPDKMISIVLSDRFINTLAELYYKAGFMTLAEIQPKDLLAPPRVSFDYSTLRLYMARPPVINTTVNSSIATFDIKASLTTTSSINQVARTYIMDLVIESDFDLQEDDREISWKVKNLRFQPQFTKDIPESVQSSIVPFLQKYNAQISEQINGFLYRMGPLPMFSSVKFFNKLFLRKQGYVVFESDVRM